MIKMKFNKLKNRRSLMIIKDKLKQKQKQHFLQLVFQKLMMKMSITKI